MEGSAEEAQRLKTRHQLHISDARDLSSIDEASIQLVVTSPPYPMIEMWDEVFTGMNPEIGTALDAEDGLLAFERMHLELDKVWAECSRVLSAGGFACINIGDATRTVSGDFRLYHNHARILSGMAAIGLTVLPDVLWRKPTNAPNKFMGSGMLPAGAYVTYEHEYILIFRKGGKRIFRTDADRTRRSKSAFFWEERNVWFSDIWTDLRGTKQKMGQTKGRGRSAAFPFELPYRLINMYSAFGDTVLDPFVGTGTTMAAALTAARSSIGIDQADELSPLVDATIRDAAREAAKVASRRLAAHRRFIDDRVAEGKTPKHQNEPHEFPVITGQERQMEVLAPRALHLCGKGQYEVHHEIYIDGRDAPPVVTSDTEEGATKRSDKPQPASAPI
jgi:DNA modification methylase